jgi:hypothetical protein
MKNMNYRQIKLASGKVVTLERFEMSFTYDGLLLGRPDKEMNDRIIEDAIKKYNQNKVLVLTEDAYVSDNRLKPIMFSAELTSQPINDKEEVYDGSYLNVVWFGGDFKNHTIEKMLGDLKGFDFDLEADNYQF